MAVSEHFGHHDVERTRAGKLLVAPHRANRRHFQMSTELTLTSGSPPRASTKEQVLQPTSKPLSSYTLKKYIWRPYVTSFERIVDRHYSGSGTEEDAYIVDWLPDDPEDPQRWGGVYKWSQIFLVSFATLAVALSSSAYSGGIKSLEREYGARPELLTAGMSGRRLGLWRS